MPWSLLRLPWSQTNIFHHHDVYRLRTYEYYVWFQQLKGLLPLLERKLAAMQNRIRWNCGMRQWWQCRSSKAYGRTNITWTLCCQDLAPKRCSYNSSKRCPHDWKVDRKAGKLMHWPLSETHATFKCYEMHQSLRLMLSSAVTASVSWHFLLEKELGPLLSPRPYSPPWRL